MGSPGVGDKIDFYCPLNDYLYPVVVSTEFDYDEKYVISYKDGELYVLYFKIVPW